MSIYVAIEAGFVQRYVADYHAFKFRGITSAL